MSRGLIRYPKVLLHVLAPMFYGMSESCLLDGANVTVSQLHRRNAALCDV